MFAVLNVAKDSGDGVATVTMREFECYDTNARQGMRQRGVQVKVSGQQPIGARQESALSRTSKP